MLSRYRIRLDPWLVIDRNEKCKVFVELEVEAKSIVKMSNETNNCAASAPGILPNSPGHTAALVLTIIFPFTICGMVFTFWWFKGTSVFLRKRKFGSVVIAAAATSLCWSVTSLYDYLGPQAYPCWLYMLCIYLSIPLVICPVIIRLLDYFSEGECVNEWSVVALNGVATRERSKD